MNTVVVVMAAFLNISPSLAQTELSHQQMRSMTASRNYSEGSVHDPSVVFDPNTSTYYVVGSHLDVAKSSNLSSWTKVATGTNHSSFLNKGYQTAFSSNPSHRVKVRRGNDTIEATLGSFDAGAFCATYSQVHLNDSKQLQAMTQSQWISGNMWAPDIIYNPHMGKWCMYLSLNGDYWASVVILLTADKPTGPFVYEAPIVFGGFNGQTYTQNGVSKSVDYHDTDLELVLGEQASLPSRYRTSSWGNVYPNCIDPCVFFDEQGELWMTYGSWSGGIYILKLDRNTGLRDYTCTYAGTGTSPSASATSDAYFGKKIAGGYYVSGEGSYIKHIGDYYYLFLSYGFFSPEGGYEMRVFRSSSPDGPYVDGNGISAIFNSSYQLNYGPSAATNRGMKLMGAMNGWGTMTVGECAQGHNSAIVDADDNAFLVCHTKFNNGTTSHQMRVHQLFVNEKGWLVAAPFRHAAVETTQKQIESSQLFSADEIAGTYSMLIHPYRLNHNNFAEAKPVKVTLTSDGRIVGAANGTWEYTHDGQSYVKLVISGVTYYGVALSQSVHGYSDMKARCLSAVSTGGVPVWLYRYTPEAALAASYDGISSYLANPVVGDAPQFDNVTAVYASDDYDALSADGKFTPTADGHAINVSVRASSGNYFYVVQGSPLTAKQVDGLSGLMAYYRLNSVNCVNECNPTEKLSVGRASSSGTVPSITNDAQKGSVLHQYFGAQSAASYARIPNPLLGSDAEAFSVALWVKRLDSNVWDALFGFFSGETPTASGGRCYLTGNAYLGYNDNNGHWFDINHPNNGTYADIPAEQWNLVVLTVSPSGPKLYVNGVEKPVHAWSANNGMQQTSFSFSDMIATVSSYKYLYLGAGSWWGSAPACFSELAVYNHSLSAVDVASLYVRMSDSEPLVSAILPVVTDAPSRPRSSATYNLWGQPVSDDYRGIVISGGKKILRK